MPNNLDRFKSDLNNLIAVGAKLTLDLRYRAIADERELNETESANAKEVEGAFESEYQNFYTQALALIRQLIPERLGEFEKLYECEPRRKSIGQSNYSIQDWLNGIRSSTNSITGEKGFNDFGVILMRFSTQYAILRSCESRFESSLFDIKQLVQADLLDSELESAAELIKRGFLRGAGAICGVVLEKHLAQVLDNHSISTRKKAPSINDFNELLKKNGIIDVPLWRQIQRFGDIRNLCDHNKERDPSKEELEELVNGVEKITKTLF